jgi:hypothetical protein
MQARMHRHVEEGGADIDDDLDAEPGDQRLGGLDVHAHRAAWPSNTPSCFIAFLACTEAMMESHFALVREAMWMSPSTSLFWAHLWATTWATPPAPIMSTFFFMMGTNSYVQSSDALLNLFRKGFVRSPRNQIHGPS